MSRSPAQMSASGKPQPLLLIVSSYGRQCGIAQYVEFLERPLHKQSDFRVEIAPLPVDLFRLRSQFARRAAKREFDDILARATKADVVNIQLEPGLFGAGPLSSLRRIRNLIRASKRVIITYHSSPTPIHSKGSMTLKAVVERAKERLRQHVFDKLLSMVRAEPSKFHHIVHTRREMKNLVLVGIPKESITTEPLSFLEASVRETVSTKPVVESFARRYGLEGQKVLGCFGFLSPYKGLEVAIRALRYLPPDFHLVVVGGLHPEGLAKATVDQPYLRQLLSELEMGKRASNISSMHRSRVPPPFRLHLNDSDSTTEGDLFERVHFVGSVGNDEFNEIMAGCHSVVLPYVEVGQSSSGPAAIALDLGKPIYCSHNLCFRELDRFQPGMLSFFEIGNHIELAQKIARGDAETPARQEAKKVYTSDHNVERRAGLYVRAADMLVRQSTS